MERFKFKLYQNDCNGMTKTANRMTETDAPTKSMHTNPISRLIDQFQGLVCCFRSTGWLINSIGL